VRFSVGAVLLAVAAGCSAPHRTLTLVPSLPDCPHGAVNTVRVTAQGDFPPEATLTAAASPATPATLNLPRATRDVVIEGFGPMGLAAFGRTATLVLDGVAAGPLAIAYGPPDGLCATAPMNVARSGHRATVLGSGAVLITGGDQQIELYDPRTARFLLGEILRSDQLYAHAASALDDGGALVTGGLGAAGEGIASQAAVRYDAAGKQVGQPRLLLSGRAQHSATTLADGRVLLAGGCRNFAAGGCVTDAALSSTEIYDPSSDTVAPGPSLLHARFGHQAILRGDGSVLLVGGRGEGGGALPAEIVDPDELRGFDAGLSSGAAAGLPTGSALVAGGTTTPDTTMSLWLSAAELPVALPSLARPRLGPTLTPLDDGAVLVAGGGDGALALYDGRSAVTTLAAAFSIDGQAAARLADGTVLLSGGDDGGQPTASAALYFHSPLSPWASLPPLTLDGSADPYLPRRPDRASAGGGQLAVTAAAPSPDGRPADFALIAGMQVADFTFDVLAGSRGPAGAAILAGWQSDAAYDFVVLEPGRAVELWAVSSPRAGQSVAAPVAACRGATLPAAALPDGDTAALDVAWRGGILSVTFGGGLLLSCRPPALPRGAVGVGALHGTAVFDNLALTR